MPLYEYECEECGYRFDAIREIGTETEPCPKCGSPSRKLISAPARIIINEKESLRYGNKSKGRFVPAEKGRRNIFVPSFGAMEKEEIDYVVEVAQEQEDERIRSGYKSPQKKRLEQVVEVTRQAPAGERAKTAREAIKEV